MDRVEEIRVLILSLVKEDQEKYVDRLLGELQLTERKSGYNLFKKLCSRVANLTYNKHSQEYPSNVLDYLNFLCYGGEQIGGWKPNNKVHAKLLEYYEANIKWRIHD